MKQKLKFELNHLDQFAIITKPDTFKIKTRSKIVYDNLIDRDEHARWIVGIKAITEFNLNLIKGLIAEGRNLSYFDIGNLLMTGVIWEDQIRSPEELPVKGEEIIAVFDNVNDNVVCTGITIIPRRSPEFYCPAEEFLKEINEFEQIIKEMNNE